MSRSQNLRKRAQPLSVEQAELATAEAYQMLDRFGRLHIMEKVAEDLLWNQRFASKATAEAFIERQLLLYTVLALTECLDLAGRTIEQQHERLADEGLA